MAIPRFLSLLTAIAVLVRPSVQQKDPLKDFCRRFGHQTTVIGNKMFIDGGLINYNPLDQNPLNYTNTGLLYADLNVNNLGMPMEYANLSKPATIPSVSGGILWNDDVNQMVYLYGGEFQINPQSFAMYSYDPIFDKWASLPPDISQNGIQRASYGAGVTVQDRGLAYYYGGWLSNSSVPTWGSQPIALSNLLQYDMVKNTWTNSSGPDSVGRAEGSMVYLPASDGGMLIYFGGIQSTVVGNWTGQPLSTIYIYDIANAKWYTQKATGDVPDMRRKFCSGATWSADQSSYQIYVYGGASMPPTTVGFDDIYILTIPSFTWIKWYPDAPGASFPHHSLSCNVINGNQMIVQGGSFPNSSICDVPTVFGMHNMDMAKNNKDSAKWALFDPKKKGYKVPTEVLAVVGGTADGGATNRVPKAGFDSNDLNVYFTRVYSIASTRTATRSIPTATGTATPPKPTKKSGNGAVIGGAVGGGVAALAIIAALVWFCLRRKNQPAPAHQPVPQQDMASPQHPGAYTVYPNAPPAQLATHEHGPIAELSGAEVSGAAAAGHKSWGSVSGGEKAPQYSYFPQGSSHPSSPSQSPPPAHSPPAPGYFSPHGAPQAAPVYYPQQPIGTAQPFPQQHYPPPGSPPQQQYYHPPGQSQQYSPPSQHAYPTPTSAHSPDQGFTPSPINVVPRKELPPQ